MDLRRSAMPDGVLLGAPATHRALDSASPSACDRRIDPSVSPASRRCGCSIFRATSAPVKRWRARKTTPMPSSPRTPVNSSKRPSTTLPTSDAAFTAFEESGPGRRCQAVVPAGPRKHGPASTAGTPPRSAPRCRRSWSTGCAASRRASGSPRLVAAVRGTPMPLLVALTGRISALARPARCARASSSSTTSTGSPSRKSASATRPGTGTRKTAVHRVEMRIGRGQRVCGWHNSWRFHVCVVTAQDAALRIHRRWNPSALSVLVVGRAPWCAVAAGGARGRGRRRGAAGRGRLCARGCGFVGFRSWPPWRRRAPRAWSGLPASPTTRVTSLWAHLGDGGRGGPAGRAGGDGVPALRDGGGAESAAGDARRDGRGSPVEPPARGSSRTRWRWRRSSCSRGTRRPRWGPAW